jgi:hypothetical protein
MRTDYIFRKTLKTSWFGFVERKARAKAAWDVVPRKLKL